ncbi:MAG: PAS domain-containing protein [Spirochaetes bacterium]|nr:PAS domain-containing protein [Spirochaetota bacterium]
MTDIKEKKTADRPLFYVAIGASAGGLEAIEEFFRNMPADSELAFVVIQHLSPDYKSLMVELLSKKTAMPVNRAEDGLLVKANNVYLIPPKKNLTIFHGKLLLTEQDHSKGINLPIDVFLRSLAEDQGEKGIAIILSGTGSDGMRGVRLVKENGGMVMVQDEDSAKFNGMPRAAISTGLPDFVLTPAEMPKQLLTFIKRPYSLLAVRADARLSDEDGLTRIFALLREKCKIDFTFYKPNTVIRRIERRMTVTQCESISDYVAFMNNYPGEVATLFRELLIGVTSFFRDQAAFDRLAAEELPALINAAEGRELRLWVAACSTGEEAYSLAILLRECMDSMGVHRDVKIFATDIDRDAIHFAATGLYPESVAADLSPRYLSKYFYKREDSFQVARNIREMVVFAQHNLIKDPPFTNIDLVSCRNILIYLQPTLQNKVLDYFNFSLLQHGILFLGTSETTGDSSDLFELLDAKNKIYRSRGRSRVALDPAHVMNATDTRARGLKDHYAGLRRSYRPHEEDRILERLFESLSVDYLPLIIVVNEQLEAVHVLGDTTGYFKIPSGKQTSDISKMAVKEIAIPLITGVQKVFRQKAELRFTNIALRSMDKVVDLRIRPMPARKDQEPLVVVFLIEAQSGGPVERTPGVLSYDLTKEAEQRIHDLEQELQFTNENLQATIEELETSNEELQATNEELLASNEELQSTNEELQSTNEELFTVNAEYHSKILELTELHNDLDNLLTVSHIGLLLLDENMDIRRFSPQIATIFKLLASDVGRPITHISHFIQNEDPLACIREVQKNHVSLSREIQVEDNRFYLMRVLPYSVGPKVFSGTVLAFSDITEIKQAEEALLQSQRMFMTVTDTSPALVWMSSVDKLCFWFNKTWLEFTGRSMEQEKGNGWAEGVHPEDFDRCLEIYTSAFDKHENFYMRYRLRHAGGEYRYIDDYGSPRFKDDGEFLGYIGSCLDVSRQVELERQLAEANEQLQLAGLSQGCKVAESQ